MLWNESPGALAAAGLGGGACEPPHRATEQTTTNWRTVTSKKFLHCCNSSGPTTDFPTWGSSKGTENPHRNWTLETSGIWLQDFHGTLETDSWRARTKSFAYQDPGERSSDPTRDWARRACDWLSRRSQRRCGGTEACRGVRGTEYTSSGISPFAGGPHHLHCPCLASGQTTGREHSPTHQQKMGFKIYWAWPWPSEQDPDSPTSPSHQEAATSLLSLSNRGQTD